MSARDSAFSAIPAPSASAAPSISFSVSPSRWPHRMSAPTAGAGSILSPVKAMTSRTTSVKLVDGSSPGPVTLTRSAERRARRKSLIPSRLPPSSRSRTTLSAKSTPRGSAAILSSLTKLVRKRGTASAIASLFFARMFVCGSLMPRGLRKRAVTANQSASAPTSEASKNAERSVRRFRLPKRRTRSRASHGWNVMMRKPTNAAARERIPM